MTLSFNVSLTTAGRPLELAMGNRVAMLYSHESFSLAVIQAFSDVIQTTAPRDTGFMADSVSEITYITSDDGSGFGAGSYEKIGDPKKKASKGTIKRFVKAYPKLRGKRPLAPKGAWWMLSKAGKAQLQESRRQGVYGGAKPAYWYAIARGFVPDASGNRMPANIFVDFAVDYANSERKLLAGAFFGDRDRARR